MKVYEVITIDSDGQRDAWETWAASPEHAHELISEMTGLKVLDNYTEVTR